MLLKGCDIFLIFLIRSISLALASGIVKFSSSSFIIFKSNFVIGIVSSTNLLSFFLKLNELFLFVCLNALTIQTETFACSNTLRLVLSRSGNASISIIE